MFDKGTHYNVGFEAVAVSAVSDLLEITAGERPLLLKRVRVTQSTEAGDAEAERIRFQILRGVGHTPGSGGANADIRKLDTNARDAGFTVSGVNGTIAVSGSGDLTVLEEQSEDVQTGFSHDAIDDHPAGRCYRINPGQSLIVRVASNPADSVTFSAVATVLELE